MTQYDYFIAGFESLDAEFLRQLIVAQPSLSLTYWSLGTSSITIEGVDGYTISVFFSDVLSGPAETLLSGIMANYMTSVPVAKMKKLSQLQLSIQSYIESHYNINTRIQLMNLYTLAIFDGKTNRANYLRPGMDWINSILTYAATTATAIQALVTFQDVQAYTINIAGNVGADPNLTVGAAVLIPN